MMLKTSDVIALVAAVVAGLSLAISIYAIGSTERIATSGFQSAQKVKLDTATLLAALRSTMVKAALYSQQDPKLRDDPNYPHYIDIRPERASIQGFLNSSTAIAYYLFVAQKSAEARKAGKSREDGGLFFCNSKISLAEVIPILLVFWQRGWRPCSKLSLIKTLTICQTD